MSFGEDKRATPARINMEPAVESLRNRGYFTNWIESALWKCSIGTDWDIKG
jgi:hypothetical protein